ncbi:TPA: hypothetical protein MEA92_004859 [Klebsiella aerogenes]|nr:hypothetical protein [Klebsiella aerogenes]HBV9945991.1 hypothetical protein [Klebsiella aerogenes]HDS5323692.1 hypothetical protein [Klebsiella aerogenes]
MKLKAFFIVSLVLTVSSSIIYSEYSRENRITKGVNCFAQVQYNYDQDGEQAVLKTGILFALTNGHGIVSYGGRLYHDGKSYTIKRYIEVNYTVKSHYTVLLRTRNLKVANSDDIPDFLANKYLYSYLRDETGWMNIVIYPNGQNGFVMSTTPVPQFLCKRVN